MVFTDFAGFDGDAEVMVSLTQFKKIKELKRGEIVGTLSFDGYVTFKKIDFQKVTFTGVLVSLQNKAKGLKLLIGSSTNISFSFLNKTRLIQGNSISFNKDTLITQAKIDLLCLNQDVQLYFVGETSKALKVKLIEEPATNFTKTPMCIKNKDLYTFKNNQRLIIRQNDNCMIF